LRVEELESRLVPSDGTGAGTVLVKDFFNSATGVTPSIYEMGDLNGTLLASVEDGGSGFQGVDLWRSDGTATGTSIVAGVEALSPFTVIGKTAYFEGEDATTPDFELFRTDGTTAGTYWLNAGSMSHPNNLTNVNGTLFFNAYDPTHGYELWKSDGTAAGTVMVKDINPGSGGSNPSSLTNVNGTLFFDASDGTSSGTGLWKSDGTAAGTVLVQGGIGASNLTNVNGTLFFSGFDSNSGTELWKSDGTTKGTKLVKDIYSGSTSINEHYYSHFHFKRPNSSYPASLTNVNGTLFFTAYEPTDGRELWKSDGTSKGTVLVTDIDPGAGSSSPVNLTIVNNTLFFNANDGTTGNELWKSDGTAAGTVLVKDINPGSSSSLPENLTSAGGILYFSAYDGTNGYELWKSDGTAAGTVMVKDINPGSAGSYPRLLTVSGGHLFFSVHDATDGDQLWDPPIAARPAEDVPLDSSAASPSLAREASDWTFALAADPAVLRTSSLPAMFVTPREETLAEVSTVSHYDFSAPLVDQIFADAAARLRMAGADSTPDGSLEPEAPVNLALDRQFG
jgi:ELWxxDGT repeat protein